MATDPAKTIINLHRKAEYKIYMVIRIPISKDDIFISMLIFQQNKSHLVHFVESAGVEEYTLC